MRVDFPRVPTMMGGVDDCTLDVALDTLGVMPVTAPMSDAKSAAARCTPGHSSAEMRIGAAFPALTMEKLANDGLNVTQVSWPMACTLTMAASRPKAAEYDEVDRGSHILETRRKMGLRMLETSQCTTIYAAKASLGR